MTDNGIHLNLSLGLSNQPGPPQRIEGKNDRSKVANLLAALDELKAKVGIPLSIKDSGLEEKQWLDQIDLVAARDAEGRDWISFDEIKR